MDFIERIFGVAPDGGSGALEAALFIVPALIASLAIALRKRSRSRRKIR